MATLSETARSTHKIIKFAIIGLLAIIFLRTSWSALRQWWQARHPAPPPAPTVAFGKLPKLVFPQAQKEVKVILETITGTTPDLPDQGVVYQVTTQIPNLLALDRAKEKAKRLGLLQEPEKISEDSYRWTNFARLPETLEMNITTGSFTLKKNWQKDPTLLLEKNLPGKEEAVIEAKSFLQQAGVLTEDLKEAQTQVTYLKFLGNDFKPAPSLSEADFVRVDLFRTPVEELSFFTLDPEEGIVYLILSGSRTNYKRVVEVVYRYSPLDYQNPATYPLKSSSLAWEELENGQGFIASVNPGITQVKVRKIYLGCFDSYQPQKFIQPIFVFEGDYNFRAYVPAIAADWYQQPPTGG